ncbi:hypothetical protein CLOM_g13360 [Closterium sp. NIES-68]|nr:hypothetical protein CLOM_g22725 [Closterium sp. NIES-68]GJP54250.1 hypothetical protein CLOM_g13360 [Closterium sp. NIES-68]GJP60535.1 hypothetical protein CLOP_g17778 [Closterium sp. NIES-67]
MAARVVRAQATESRNFSPSPAGYLVTPSSSAFYQQRSINCPDAYPADYPAAHPSDYPAAAYSCSSANRPRFTAPPLDASYFQSQSAFDWSLSTLDGSPSALDEYSFEAEDPAIEAFQSTSPRALLPSYATFASHDFAERGDGFARSAHHYYYPSAASWSGGSFSAAPLPQKHSANRRGSRVSRGSRAAAEAAASGRGMIVQAAGARRRPAIGIKQLRALEAARQKTVNQAAASAEVEAEAEAEAQAQPLLRLTRTLYRMHRSDEALVSAFESSQQSPSGETRRRAESRRRDDEEGLAAEAAEPAEFTEEERATRRDTSSEAVRRPLLAATRRSNSTPPEETKSAREASGGDVAARGGGGGDSGELAGVGGTTMRAADCPFRTKRAQQAAILGLHSTSAPPELGATYDDPRHARGGPSNGRGVAMMFPPPVARRRTESFESLESPRQPPSSATSVHSSGSQSPSQSPSVRHAPPLQSRSSLPPLQSHSHSHRHRGSQSRSRSPSPSPSPLQTILAVPLQAPPRRDSSIDAPQKPAKLRTSQSLSVGNYLADAGQVRRLNVAPKPAEFGFLRSGGDGGSFGRHSPVKHPLSKPATPPSQVPYALKEAPLRDFQSGLHCSTVPSHQHMRRGSLPAAASPRMESPPARLYSNCSKISALPTTEFCKSTHSPSISPSKPPPSLSPSASPSGTSLYKLPSDNLQAVASTHYNRYMHHGPLRQKSRLGLRTTSVDLGDIAAGSAHAGLVARQARQGSGLYQGEVDVGEMQQERENVPRQSVQRRARPNSISVCPSAYTPLSPYGQASVATAAVAAAPMADQHFFQQHRSQHQHQHHRQHQQQYQQQQPQQPQHQHQQHQHQRHQHQQYHQQHDSQGSRSNASPPHSPPHQSIRTRRALPSLAVNPLGRPCESASSILRTSSLTTNTAASSFTSSTSPPLLFPPPPALTVKQSPLEPPAPFASFQSRAHCRVVFAGSSSASASPHLLPSAAPGSPDAASPGVSPSPGSPSPGSASSGNASPCPLPKSILTVRDEGSSSIGRTRSLGRLVRFNKVAQVHIIV